MRSRPLRFVVLVLCTWVGGRAYLLTSIALSPAASRAAPAVPTGPARIVTRPWVSPASASSPTGSSRSRVAAVTTMTGVAHAPGMTRRIALSYAPHPTPSVASPALGPGVAPPAPEAATLPASIAVPAHRSPVRRLSASAWILARGAGDVGGLSGGQLGGSQAGVRIAYLIDNKRRIALVGRVATPLAGSGAEAAAGIEWQPTRLPVRLVAEERVLIDTGRAAPAAGIIGGFGPVSIRQGLRAEGYGQAGVIARDGGVAYVDGLARVTKPVLANRGAEVTVGAGAWGGAQPGVARLDLGPSIGVNVPVAGRTLRLAADWRERVAGRARPGSGLTIVAGMDF